jgi:hypothetical protein
MADNLHVGITADTSKARTELDLLNEKMKVTGREAKALAAAAVKTGDPKAVENLKKVNVQIDAMAKGQARLRKEINASTSAAKAHGEAHAHGLYLVENSLQSLNGALMALGHNLGGAKAAIAGFAVGIGFTKLNELLNDFSKNLGELRTQAGEIGIKPIQLQGAQRAVEAIGDDAEIATKALQGMNAQFEELRKNPPQPGAPGFGSAFGVQVHRGGEPGATDFSKPLQMLGIEAQVGALAQSRAPEAPLRAMRLELQALVRQARNFDPTALNIISKTLFSGVPANAMLKVAPQLLKQWEAEIKNLEQSSAGATDKALKEDQELIASKNAVANSYKDAAATIATTLRPLQLWWNETLSTGLTRSSSQFQKDFGSGGTIAKAWERDVAQFKKDIENLGKVLSGPSDAFTKPAQDMKTEFGKLPGFFRGLTANIAGLWKRLADAAKATGSTAVLPDVKLPGMPQVFRGGATSGSVYNPEGEDVGGGYRLLYGGHGPYGHRVQSTTPGVSDYQAPPPQRVEPSAVSTYGPQSAEVLKNSSDAAVAAKAAAERAEDAALAAKEAAEASKTAVDALSYAQNKTISGGLAGGGMISGPGSSTSDSIMARLSNGEFVMNAGAVSHWGAGAMAALNGLRNPFGGGSLPRFASGGLVGTAAGGGTPVHVHLDGQSFAMRADDAVAQSLAVASRRYQMRSAGVKPSWYGGRPGG